MRRGSPLVCLVVLFALACDSGVEPAPEVVRSVLTSVVEAPGGARRRVFSGVAQSRSQKKLSFRVSGEIVSLPLQVGDVVEASTLVARLDPIDYRIEVREARASVLQSRAQKRNDDAAYERSRALYEEEGASKEELDSARAAAESAAASLQASIENLKLAEQRVAYTTLQTPARGAVSEVLVEIGENVGQGDPVITLQTGEAPEVEVSLPEQLISGVSPGEEVSVDFDALPGRTIVGRVTEVGIAPVGGGSTFPVTIQLDADWNPIRPGLAANVGFRFESSSRGEVVVPPSAIGSDRDGHYVYLVEPAEGELHVTRRVAVEVGELAENGIAVVSGLSGGERLVVAGVQRIRDGLSVRVLSRGDWF